MSEGAVGFLVLLGLTAGAAVLWHALVKSYLLASVAAGLTAAGAFQVFDYVHRGHLDMFFHIVIMVTVPLCCGLSLIIGLPFLLRRTRQERNRLRNGHDKQETSSRTPEVDRRWLWAFRIAAVVCFPLAARAVSSFFPPRSFEDSVVLFLFLLPYAFILWGLRRHPNRATLSLAVGMGWVMGLVGAVMGFFSGSVLFLALAAAHVALAATAIKVRQAEPATDY